MTLSSAQRYLLAILIFLITLMVRVVMAPLWETTAPFALFMIATVAAAWFAGIGPALLTGAAGILARLYFDSPTSPGGSGIPWDETVRLTLFGGFVVGTAITLTRMRRYRLQLEASIAAALREIDERRRVEADLQTARATAEEASRLKDEFLALVSHELRTPLNAILGWVTLLRNTALPAERTSHALEIIQKNAMTQAQLVADLLDVARGLTGQIRLELAELELNTVVRATVDSSRASATAREIQISLNLADEPLMVWGDPARLHQVVGNLLSNATKFTPNGGEIAISLARRDGSAELIVTDTGAGIEPEFAPHLFEPFRQAETGATRRYSGLGLGLAIVEQLVLMHGGSVSGTSAGPNGGARFTILLPLRAQTADLVGPVIN